MTEDPRAVVLVVDDTPDNLKLMSGLLKDLYRVKIANGGEKALAIAASDAPPDLILLDIMMPEMDGYTVNAIGAGTSASNPRLYPRKRDELWFRTPEKARATKVAQPRDTTTNPTTLDARAAFPRPASPLPGHKRRPVFDNTASAFAGLRCTSDRKTSDVPGTAAGRARAGAANPQAT